jgi:hypothetical protein
MSNYKKFSIKIVILFCSLYYSVASRGGKNGEAIFLTPAVCNLKVIDISQKKRDRRTRTIFHSLKYLKNEFPQTRLVLDDSFRKGVVMECLFRVMMIYFLHRIGTSNPPLC